MSILKKAFGISAAVAICINLTACGGTPVETNSSTSTTTSEATTTTTSEATTTTTSEATTTTATTTTTQTDILYAVFGADNVKEYPIEYTGEKKTAEELAQELSKLTGLDFNITASKTDDGWVVDWAADSTLIAGLDNREQKEEFFFFDFNSLNWFMMDSLWRTLTENLNAENIYYTMDGGKELTFEELYPVNEFPSDIPYMGSEFYFAHSDVRGDDENNYACTKGLWRLDGATDTASIEMDGSGEFTMYYADGAVEAVGYLECVDENGSYQYDMYNSEGEFIVSFYFDSDTQFHLVNDAGSVYLLDTQAAYQGLWDYPDGKILEINGDEWRLYEDDSFTMFADGLVRYDEDAVWLLNDEGSSVGGGYIRFDENNNLVDSSYVLTYRGGVPKG